MMQMITGYFMSPLSLDKLLISSSALLFTTSGTGMASERT